jgi:hypothetical protein
MDPIRFDANSVALLEQRPDRREELVNWIASLGVDINDALPVGLVVMAEREYELHLTRYIRDEQGRMRLDRAAERAVTEPLVIGLGTSKSWPAWLETAE